MSNNQQNQNKEENLSKYDTALGLVQLRQMLNANLMQENSRLFILVFVLIIGVVIALTNYAIVIKKNTPPYYITVNENNQYLAPIPLHEPMYNENTMKSKTIQVSKILMRYDYFSYLQQINDNRFLFTTDGWDSYKKALENSQTLEMIKQYKMIVKFEPTSAPVLLRHGTMNDGRYAWEFEMKGNFQTQKQDPQSKMIIPINYEAKVKVLWVREGIHKYEDGVAVQRFELSFMK